MRHTVTCVTRYGQDVDVNEDRILTNLRKGVVEFCVLALLRSDRAYGFELVRSLKKDDLIASEGTLYPLLARLHSGGMVTTEWVESDSGRPRKYYTLTAQGLVYLNTFERAWGTIRHAVDHTLKERP